MVKPSTGHTRENLQYAQVIRCIQANHQDWSAQQIIDAVNKIFQKSDNVAAKRLNDG